MQLTDQSRQMSQHEGPRKRRLDRLSGCFDRMRADARLEPFGVLRFNLFLAIPEGLNAALPFLGGVGIESVFNPPQRNMQRNAALFPAFNQCPINRTQEQMFAAAADEGVFDFREIGKVIQGFNGLIYEGTFLTPGALYSHFK